MLPPHSQIQQKGLGIGDFVEVIGVREERYIWGFDGLGRNEISLKVEQMVPLFRKGGGE